MLKIERDSCSTFQGRHVDLPLDALLASPPKEEASRVELSLNGRVVTIGTSATLAYLHDAACKGCERGGASEEERKGDKANGHGTVYAISS